MSARRVHYIERHADETRCGVITGARPISTTANLEYVTCHRCKSFLKRDADTLTDGVVSGRIAPTPTRGIEI